MEIKVSGDNTSPKIKLSFHDEEGTLLGKEVDFNLLHGIFMKNSLTQWARQDYILKILDKAELVKFFFYQPIFNMIPSSSPFSHYKAKEERKDYSLIPKMIYSVTGMYPKQFWRAFMSKVYRHYIGDNKYYHDRLARGRRGYNLFLVTKLNKTLSSEDTKGFKKEQLPLLLDKNLKDFISEPCLRDNSFNKNKVLYKLFHDLGWRSDFNGREYLNLRTGELELLKKILDVIYIDAKEVVIYIDAKEVVKVVKVLSNNKMVHYFMAFGIDPRKRSLYNLIDIFSKNLLEKDKFSGKNSQEKFKDLLDKVYVRSLLSGSNSDIILSIKRGFEDKDGDNIKNTNH